MNNNNMIPQPVQEALIELTHTAIANDAEQQMEMPQDWLKMGVVVIKKDSNNIKVNPEIPASLYNAINTKFGNLARRFNNTFHKSFQKVATAPMIQLVSEQIANYFSNYGMESFGLEAFNFIPIEVLNIPELNGDNYYQRMFVIQLVSIEYAIHLVEDLFKEMRSPSDIQKEYLRSLLSLNPVLSLSEIRSFELMIMYCDRHGIVPNNPQDALRFIIYKITGRPLLIKDDLTINRIKECAENYSKILRKVIKAVSVENWATIFYRYKPLFLAMKKDSELKPVINSIRRLAKIYHRPMTRNTIQYFTQIAKEALNGDSQSEKIMTDLISKASNRDLVKLINLYLAKINGNGSSQAFNIRNGSTFVKEISTKFDPVETYHNARIFRMLAEQLKSKFGDKYLGQPFILPDDVTYAVPASEKQVTGILPWGSYIKTPDEAFVAGIHWFNQKRRTDLDLHMLSSTGKNLGWNSSYRDNRGIYFSGDQTDAPLPNGAAEAFWFDRNAIEDDYVLTVSAYSAEPNCDFTFFMTSEAKEELERDYTFNPNKQLFSPIPMRFNGSNSSETIGLFHDGHFFVYGGSLATGSVPHALTGNYTKAIVDRITNVLTMDALIVLLGGIVFYDRDRDTLKNKDYSKEPIDLAISNLTPATLLEFIDNEER